MKLVRVFLLAALLVPGTAVAAMLDGPALSDRVTGATLRTSIWAGSWPEHHLWRFSADGTVRGVFHASNILVPGNYHMEEHDTGRWSVEAGRLCVQWERWLNGERHCFTVETMAGNWVRLSGDALTLEGTLTRR